MDYIWLYLLRFVLIAFALYLGAQVLTNIPLTQRFMQQPIGQLLVFLILVSVAILLLLYLPKLRLLHELRLIRSARYLVWPDIVFSALALVRMSYLCPKVLEWFERQST